MSSAESPLAKEPRAQAEIDSTDLGSVLRGLRGSRLFWVGLMLKALAAGLFGSHFASRWFGPFIYEFVHGRHEPWTAFAARGEHLAFPYGPGMLGLLSVSWLPALVFSFDPSSHIGLFLLRVPLLVADLAILLFLMRWLRVHARDALVAYWLSPIVFYSTYIHGQLDILPTALLCSALYLLFARRLVLAALTLGLALATKGHLLIAVPFLVVYLYRQRRRHTLFLLVVAITAGALYAFPSRSEAFRSMVFGGAEAKKLWAVTVPYGAPGLALYVAPAALVVSLLRFASYRKVNRELLLMFLGAVYVALVALVPPQPGWFLWSTPFVAYLAARLSRPGKMALVAMSTLYVTYFFVADPVVFLEAADPLRGAGAGAQTAAHLGEIVPQLFSSHAASIVWTALFSTTVIIGFEMYRKGVRSNSVYAFRDQTFMIGIGGDSGAGKHTLARDLHKLFEATMTLVNGDDDHRWERGHAMWRQYTHLDPRGNLLSAQHDGLDALRRGGAVRKRHYDHDQGKFTDPILLAAKDFVTIVGLHPFYLASQRRLLHLKVFVEPKEEIRRAWKVARDVAKRGYTPDQVLEQLDRRAKDSAAYIAPQKRHADVVVRLMEPPRSASSFSVEYEISNPLEPLGLFDVLSRVEGLEVEWLPDANLERDTLRITGDLDASQLRLLAHAAIADLDELCDARLTSFEVGSRGMTQLVLLHSMRARLRAGSSEGAG